MKNEELFQIKGSILTIRVPAELDHHLADEIRSGAEAIQSTHNIRQIDFDFGQTTFMDSSGIGVLAGRYRKISCFGGKVYVIHADERIRRILRMSGLTDLVEIME